MAEERAKRKLSAILSADVKGYSRLMGEDELATIETLKNYREIMAVLINKFQGRVVDSPGDNVLAEFSSVVDALDCAVAMQKELKQKNEELPETRRMEFRIGVNLGDVVEDGERIYGDGVNIAARVESLAEGGGICISGTAFDQVGKKLPLGYEYLGEQTVKNIEKPVRVYRVLMEPEAAGKVIGEKRPGPRRWRWAALAAVAVLVVGAGGFAIWNFYLRPPSIEPASVEKMAYPLPEKPSIAVLPFDNMSGDPEQEYLTDGITENIIMALSKMPNMFVIARNSTFTYKGKPIKAQQVAEELGVRYVLEGSVQRSGDQLRITAQLIDAIQGHHLWAERYDRELKDIFALQDEITIKIMSALEVKLLRGGEEAAQYARRGTKNLQAYLKLLEAANYFARGTPDDYALARKLSEEAIAFDPEYSVPYNILAWTHMLDAMLGTSKSPRESIAKAFKLAQKVLAMDETDARAHTLLGNVYGFKREHEKAIAELERAVALDPNYALGYMFLAYSLISAGRSQEAIPLLKKSMRLSPLSQTHASMCFFRLGIAYRTMGQYEEALSALKKALNIRPNFFAIHLHLAATYIHLGREEEARAAAAEVRRIVPKFSLQDFAKRLPYKDKAVKERYIEALRKARLK